MTRRRRFDLTPMPPRLPARNPLTRRAFLGATAAVTGAAAVACTTEETPPPAGDQATGAATNGAHAVPGPPEERPDDGVLRFFTRSEATELDALLGVVLPGDEDDPGAREAGVLVFIDYALGTYSDGSAERSYSLPPFAEVVPGTGAPDAEDEAGRSIPLAAADAALYGGQSSATPREVMRMGLASLKRHCSSRFGGKFSTLPPARQEEVVGGLFDGSAEGFDDPSAQTFATTVRDWIVKGMFSDPAYGGNEAMAGWRLVGYPGPQRAYTPAYLLGLVPELPFQTLDDLHHFHPGEEQEAGIPGEPELPVSGSRDGHEGDHGDER